MSRPTRPAHYDAERRKQPKHYYVVQLTTPELDQIDRGAHLAGVCRAEFVRRSALSAAATEQLRAAVAAAPPPVEKRKGPRGGKKLRG